MGGEVRKSRSHAPFESLDGAFGGAKTLDVRGLGHHYRGAASNPRTARPGDTGMKVFVMAAVAGGVLALVPLVRGADSASSVPSIAPGLAAESLPAAKPHAPRKGPARSTTIS